MSYAQLDWHNGESRAGWLQVGDGHDFSGKVGAAVVGAQLAGAVPPGAHTPATALGPELAYRSGARFVIDEANSRRAPQAAK